MITHKNAFMGWGGIQDRVGRFNRSVPKPHPVDDVNQEAVRQYRLLSKDGKVTDRLYRELNVMFKLNAMKKSRHMKKSVNLEKSSKKDLNEPFASNPPEYVPRQSLYDQLESANATTPMNEGRVVTGNKSTKITDKEIQDRQKGVEIPFTVVKQQKKMAMNNILFGIGLGAVIYLLYASQQTIQT